MKENDNAVSYTHLDVYKRQVLSVVVGDCYLAVIVSVKHAAEFSAYALDRTEQFDFDVSADKLRKMLVTHKRTLKPRRAYLKAICTCLLYTSGLKIFPVCRLL